MPLNVWLFIVAITGTCSLTAAWLPIAMRWEIHDIAERRRLHRNTVVRGGGISIAVMMAVCLYMTHYFYDMSLVTVALLSGFIIFASCIGLLDDVLAFTPSKKLIVYALFSFAVAIGFYFYTQLHYTLIMLLIGLVFVHLNVWNFMDGSNGLITLQAMLIALAYLCIGNGAVLTNSVALALAGCCIGFLPFNYPNARVFLGDVGSHALGASVIVLLGLAYSDGSWNVLQILLLSSVLWTDAVLTFIRRYYRGYRVWLPHRSHLYQYLVRIGLGHTWTALAYAGYTLLCVLLVYRTKNLETWPQTIILAMGLFMGIFLHQYLRVRAIHHHRNYFI
jgi:UDP-N-acetylmuramyl pentapeptide phosphotransferase/UDP-N-acetylglucosamine-1-phosphate transferase